MSAPLQMSNAYARVIRPTDGALLGTLRLHDTEPYFGMTPSHGTVLPLNQHPSVHDAIATLCTDTMGDNVAAGLLVKKGAALYRPLLTLFDCEFMMRCDRLGQPLDRNGNRDTHKLMITVFRGEISVGEIWRNRESVSCRIGAASPNRHPNIPTALRAAITGLCKPASGHETMRLAANLDNLCVELEEAWRRSACALFSERAAVDPLTVSIDGSLEIVRQTDKVRLGKARLVSVGGQWCVEATRAKTRSIRGGDGEVHVFGRMDEACDWIAANPIHDHSVRPDLVVSQFFTRKRLAPVDGVNGILAVTPVDAEDPDDTTKATPYVVHYVLARSPDHDIAIIVNFGDHLCVHEGGGRVQPKTYRTVKGAVARVADIIADQLHWVGRGEVVEREALVASIHRTLPPPRQPRAGEDEAEAA